MQQSSHNLGHSKHRKAFGTKFPKSGFSRLMLQKDQNTLWDERRRLREAKKTDMYGSLRELFDRKE